jgi:hypothetical protein
VGHRRAKPLGYPTKATCVASFILKIQPILLKFLEKHIHYDFSLLRDDARDVPVTDRDYTYA